MQRPTGSCRKTFRNGAGVKAASRSTLESPSADVDMTYDDIVRTLSETKGNCFHKWLSLKILEFASVFNLAHQICSSLPNSEAMLVALRIVALTRENEML